MYIYIYIMYMCIYNAYLQLAYLSIYLSIYPSLSLSRSQSLCIHPASIYVYVFIYIHIQKYIYLSTQFLHIHIAQCHSTSQNPFPLIRAPWWSLAKLHQLRGQVRARQVPSQVSTIGGSFFIPSRGLV